MEKIIYLMLIQKMFKGEIAMEVKVILVAFLSIVGLQSIRADVDIAVVNNIAPHMNIDVNVCAANGNCTGWVIPTYGMYNIGFVTKTGVADEAVLIVNYRSGNHKVSKALKLPAFLDQYNNIRVTLTFSDDSGDVVLTVLGNRHRLTTYSEDV